MTHHPHVHMIVPGDGISLDGSSAITPISPIRRHLPPILHRRTEWVVYAKHPFGGPEAVLAYLSRYTHRVVIANSRLIAFDHANVTFRWKDYRADGSDRQKVMTLATGEFIRRFLIHVLSQGFHRILPCQRHSRRQYRPGASPARRAGSTAQEQIMVAPSPTNKNRSRIHADAAVGA